MQPSLNGIASDELTVAQHVKGVLKAQLSVKSFPWRSTLKVIEFLKPSTPQMVFVVQQNWNKYGDGLMISYMWCPVCGFWLMQSIYAWPLACWQVALLRRAACSKDLGPSCTPSKMAKHAGRKGVVEYSWRKACLTLRTKQIELDLGLCLGLGRPYRRTAIFRFGLRKEVVMWSHMCRGRLFQSLDSIQFILAFCATWWPMMAS